MDDDETFVCDDALDGSVPISEKKEVDGKNILWKSRYVENVGRVLFR